MSSRNNISRIPRFIRRVVACMLACALALTTLVSVPALAEEASNVGTTLMGLRVTDSSKNQHAGTDVEVGLRVTNSNSTEPVTVSVIFDGHGGSWPGEVATQTQTISVELFQPTEPPKNPDRPGYDFVGWSLDLDGKNKVDSFPEKTVESAYYVAQWKLHTYDINYEIAAGGKNNASNPDAYNVDQLPITLKDATPPTGYQFDGWTCKELEIDKATKNLIIRKDATCNLTFVAHFSSAKYKVTFDSTGGSEVKPKEVEVEYGSKVTKPTTDPTRPGYKFEAWYKDEELTQLWDFSTDTMPANEMTLYAKWSEHIGCDVPISTVFQIDAKGDVTDITGMAHEFVSKTDAPIVVTSATSTLLAGANTLFPDDAARKDVAILITPQGGVQKSIPLETTATVSLGFQIETGGTLPVSFGLHLPATARLNYLANDGTAEIASISYTVSLANP